MTLFGGNVTTPMAQLNISFQTGAMCQRMRELIAYAGLVLCSWLLLTVWTICEARTLFLWTKLALRIELGWDDTCIWNLCRWKLEFGLLL